MPLATIWGGRSGRTGCCRVALRRQKREREEPLQVNTVYANIFAEKKSSKAGLHQCNKGGSTKENGVATGLEATYHGAMAVRMFFIGKSHFDLLQPQLQNAV